MIKKYLWIAAGVFLTFFTCATSFAQETKEELKVRLTELRNKRAEMKFEHDDAQHKINMESEEKLTVIKENFRKAREECLKDEHDKSKELLKDYESKLKPMLKEEEELIKLIGIDSETDFAKAKAEKLKR